MRRLGTALILLLVLGLAPGVGARDLPSFELENWNGAEISTATLQGRTTVVAFTYAKCVFACPMITFLLNELDGELGSPDGISYLHISINPVADTAAEIRKHFKKHEINPKKDPRWLFANGPRAAIAKLIDELDIEIERKRVEGGFLIEHTIVVLVVGPDGKTVASFDSFFWDQQEMDHALRTSLARR